MSADEEGHGSSDSVRSPGTDIKRGARPVRSVFEVLLGQAGKKVTAFAVRK